ncbi:MAG: hypothetical protein AAF206_17340 [Bacteroidota bacterium]
MSTKLLSAKELAYWPDWSKVHERTLYRYAKKIRLHAGKEKRQPITVVDLADYLGLPFDDVVKTIKERKPDLSDRN